VNGPVLVLAHQGLGDHLVCNGLYRTLLDNYSFCVLPVVRRYYKEISIMFEDESRMRIYPVPNLYWQNYFHKLEQVFEKNYNIVKLGSFGDDFMANPNLRLDASFYQQANVDLENRWSRFYFPREIEKEKTLLAKLTSPGDPYIFLHEDTSRNFTIDRNLIVTDLPIVTPDSESSFLLTNYAAVIENATEVHCIESSFSALVESLNPQGKKFAHRYARPEAKNDYRYEYTYKADWSVLL
jgi:hypothetical protein